MSGFLNIFKNLFSGIFGFLGGLFGGKSKDGFYLELKEDSNTAPAAKAAPAAEAAPVVVAAPTAAPVASNSVAKMSPAKSTRAEKLAALAAEGAAEAKSAAPAAVATALNLPQPTVTQASKEPEIKTFADTYLMPLATPSRRPGANMSSFLDMARQVKKA